MDLDDPASFTIDHDGNYRATRSECELLLFIDHMQLPPSTIDDNYEPELAAMAHALGARGEFFGIYDSPKLPWRELARRLDGNVEVVREFTFLPVPNLSMFRVEELPRELETCLIDDALSYSGFVAYSDITYPSEFRTLVSEMHYIRALW
ncbi:hypothetical protein GRI38_10770 [Altererythrobacter aurantiacus]|uniref:Uncharacterized protein n=1 Tax=Parapontixanthobacter aurantiacus TaxID=1463599 RepID=A0A844ZHT9_9SPHN|nr:hypothetical protein [Parapontixanthobacter aurantiacus]MXO86507.1 hypothetical protein [Parapontixanthobacter aurantiacus]